MSGETFWRIAVFSKKIRFDIWRWAIKLKAFRGRLFRQYFNLHLRVLTIFLRISFFPFEKYPPYNFRNLNGKQSALREILTDGRQNCTLRFHKIFLKRVCIFYSLILFFLCRSGAILVQFFRDKFRQMHKCCTLRVQRNGLGIYVFWNKKFLLNIS